ncbi:hypothetical protein [Brachybacterium sp. UNK5269]|uniref:hypothetical protein n=1 Tax=Brachybacterium sp. UNK5269 TaxID=3408576 RepID=UPI003BB1B31A
MNEATDAGSGPLLGLGTWTRQGPATLVLREGAWVVLVPGLRKHVTEAAWEVLGRRPAPEEFLDQLVEAGELAGADALTALLFAFYDGTTATFGVKGTTPLAVYTAQGAQRIAGTEEEPFVLRTVEGVRRTAFGDLPAEDPIGAPRVAAGIVPVRGFVHTTVDPATLAAAERAALAAQVEKDGRSIEDPAAATRRTERPAPGRRPPRAPHRGGSRRWSPAPPARCRRPWRGEQRPPAPPPPPRPGRTSSRAFSPVRPRHRPHRPPRSGPPRRAPCPRLRRRRLSSPRPLLRRRRPLPPPPRRPRRRLLPRGRRPPGSADWSAPRCSTGRAAPGQGSSRRPTRSRRRPSRRRPPPRTRATTGSPRRPP